MSHRAKQYCDNVGEWTLPFIEVLYIANFLYCIEGQVRYINPMMDKVDQKLAQLPKE